MTTQGLQESTGAKDAATYVAKGSDPASVLRKALEVFGPNGERWIQNAYSSGDCVCAFQAFFRACDDFMPRVVARDLLRQVIETSEIETWNDAPERTFPEVKAAFEKAIQLAEQEAKS